MFRTRKHIFGITALILILVALTATFSAFPTSAETSNMETHWTFNEGSGITTTDEKADKEGTLSGKTTGDRSLPTWTNGLRGEDDSALHFDTYDEVKEISRKSQHVVTDYTINDGNPVSALSFSVWISTTYQSDGAVAIAHFPGEADVFKVPPGMLLGYGKGSATNTPNRGCGQYSNGDRRSFLAFTDRCGACSDAIDEDDIGKWHHIVAIWEGEGNYGASDQFTLYIDGVKSAGDAILPSSCGNDNSSKLDDGTLTPKGTLEIGYSSRIYAPVPDWGGYSYYRYGFFDGDIDNLRVYTRALTEGEVKEIYEEEKPKIEIDGNTTGVIGGRYSFSVNESGAWEASGNATVITPTAQTTDIIWSRGEVGARTETITVTVSDTLTDTHTIELSEPPDPTITGATQGSVGSAFTHYFTATLTPEELARPITYTWDMTGQSTSVVTTSQELKDYFSFTTDISRTYHITVTASNEWIGVITGTHAITLTAIPPNIEATLDSLSSINLGYGDTGTYSATVKPETITRPFTYTWDIAGPADPTSDTEVKRDWDNTVLSDTLAVEWLPDGTPNKPVTRIVAMGVSNPWGVVTRTNVVTLTYRPDIQDGFSKGDDNPTEISDDDGTVVLTIDEDMSTDVITFTIVDTDTVGSLTLAAHASNMRDYLRLPEGTVAISQPVESDTPYTSTLTITPPADRWGQADIRLDADDDLVVGERTIRLVVNQVNDPPSFTKGDDITVDEDAGPQQFTEWSTDLSPGPFEHTIQALEFTTENSNEAMFAEQPTFTISGTGTSELSATLHFTTKPHANGTAVVTATLQDDSEADNDTAEPQSFTITVNQVNDVPIGYNDAITTTENESVTISNTLLLQNDTDVDLEVAEIADQTLSIIKVSEAQSGTVTLNEDDGTVTYTPPLFYRGSDVFTYTLSDGESITPTARVDVLIEPLVARDDTLETREDTPLENIGATLLTNDRNPQLSTFTAVSATSEQSGTLTLQDQQVSYTPAQDFYGTDHFSYTIQTAGITDTAQVTVTVSPVNDAPFFQKGDDVAVTAGSGEQVREAWATDIRPGPTNEMTQTLTFTITNDNASLFTVEPTLDTTGKLTFTPTDANVEDTATVTVLLVDNGGTTNGGEDTYQDTFIISIGSNLAPLATTDTYTTEINTPLDIAVADLLANDTDENDDPLSMSKFGSETTQGGTVSRNGDTLTYTPPENFTGEDSFTYTISDGRLEAQGKVNIIVFRDENYYIFLPIVTRTAADLTVSFSIVPEQASYTTDDQVTINVVVTNVGNKAVEQPFWVDFYFNPQQEPTVNNRWDMIYSDNFYYGLVWAVDQTIPAGGSITLTTTPGAETTYQQDYSRNWGGSFLNGTTNLYAYVDIWSDEQYTYGAVKEDNEENNLASQQITVTETTATTMLQANGTDNIPAVPIPPRVFPIK